MSFFSMKTSRLPISNVSTSFKDIPRHVEDGLARAEGFRLRGRHLGPAVLGEKMGK